MLSSPVVHFNSSSSIGETRCVQFLPVSDMIVEGNEVFTFRAVARNSLDTFTDNGTFSLTIYDDDGLYNYNRLPLPTVFLSYGPLFYRC